MAEAAKPPTSLYRHIQQYNYEAWADEFGSARAQSGMWILPYFLWWIHLYVDFDGEMPVEKSLTLLCGSFSRRRLAESAQGTDGASGLRRSGPTT
jgi:hypothetical protein